MILRSPRFQFWMARLALAAILLMAAMPTFSRWMESRAATTSTVAMAMCAAGEGMAWMKPRTAEFNFNQAPAPMGGMQDEACVYCPLLASLAPVLLALVLLLPPLQRVLLPAWAPPGAHALPQRLGLGARGPPIFL